MSLLSLEDVEFYKILLKRNTKYAIAYAGVLQPIAEDTNYLLEYIKNQFPEYPGHDIQHSYRILFYLSKILSSGNIENLSDTEIFCLIMAALFHDTGMALYNDEEKMDEIRKKHHKYAQKVIGNYFEQNLGILQFRNRIKEAIIFACGSHGETINEVYNSRNYMKRDMIEGDQIRYSVLSSFLRIGDLLDLDSNRVNRFVLSSFSANFPRTSLAHNNRHLHVKNYYYDSREINIEVWADNVHEYQIWSLWFEYIKNEILYINSFLKDYKIDFPLPVTKISTPSNIDFEVEELRFEIDDKGGIWRVLSQSIYTDECDFVRELLQNAIDATLLTVYLDKNVTLYHHSPRSWKVDNKAVYVGLSSERQELYVIDNGIGMNYEELKNYLFKVAESGYSKLEQRLFEFPSIAKYGIGFVSCLINAENIEIFTRKQEDKNLHYVSLSSKNNMAIMQNVSFTDFVGTAIRLKLKYKFTYIKLFNYLKKCFYFPSVKIVCLDIDDIKELSSLLLIENNFDDALSNFYKLPNYIRSVDNAREEIILPLNKRFNYLKEINGAVDTLIDWVKDNKEISEDSSAAKKISDFSVMVRDVNKLLEDSEEDILSFPLEEKNISKKYLFNDTQECIDKIADFLAKLTKIRMELYTTLRKYKKPYEIIGFNEVSFGFWWKYCVIDLDSNFHITDISYFNEPVDLSHRMGVILLNHNARDNDNGYEYAAINGFLFSDGEICSSISRIEGQLETRMSHLVYEKPYIISCLEEGLNYQELCEEIEERYLDEGEDMDAIMTISDVVSALVLRENNLYYLQDVHNADIDNYDLKYDLDFNDWLHIEADRLVPGKEVDHMEKTFCLDTFLGLEPYLLCQDGIRFFNNLKGVFPIGIFKIYCNLTASSRLPLNVTRHKISEIKSEIKPWIEKKAILIQKSILTNIKDFLSNVSLEIDVEKLITNDSDINTDFLSNLLRMQFKDIVSKCL
ncbi:MAG: HD domain-containing protein [Eubacterium sp.]|nr:HD domain-containing protein [Eubacterium sp.]